MSKYKVLLRCVCFLAITVIIFSCLTVIFERKTIDGPWNYTAKVNGYLNLPENTVDVVGFGSSHMYCTLNPAVLQENGISSYVLATQQQPIKASYYYMIEALKNQSPKVFILETFMLNKSAASIADAIIADATEPLPLSWNKMKLTYAITENKESRLSYFLTLFRYATRWKSLNTQDFYFDRASMHDPYRGQVRLERSVEISLMQFEEPPVRQEICAEDLEYLYRIIELCRENDIRLILLYAPFSLSRQDYDLCYTAQCFAEEQGLDFINGMALIETVGIDPKTDFYDKGHLNISGSEKISAYVAQYLNALGLEL